MTLYLVLKYLHVLFAVIAVGFNFSYAFWMFLGRKNPKNLPFILKGIRLMDNRFTNPAYMGLAITGPLLVWLGGYSWHALWIWMSALLLVLAAVLGILAYAPLLRRQIETLEKRGPNSKEYRVLEKRSIVFGSGLYLLVAVIIFLMVTKVQIQGF